MPALTRKRDGEAVPGGEAAKLMALGTKPDTGAAPKPKPKGGKGKYGSARAEDEPPTELMVAFPGENFSIVSPFWRLSWCRTREEIEREALCIVPRELKPYNGITAQHWEDLRRGVEEAHTMARKHKDRSEFRVRGLEWWVEAVGGMV
jgi:hypothetical protein